MKKKQKQIMFTIIVAFAVISFWRGVWGLLDQVLFPSNAVMSYLLSTFIGITLLVMTGRVTDRL